MRLNEPYAPCKRQGKPVTPIFWDTVQYFRVRLGPQTVRDH
jgi:hypothetical protein